MKISLLLSILFTASFLSLQAQDGLFKTQESRQFLLESELLPWLEGGLSFKVGMIDERRAFGLRYAQQTYELDAIFEGTFTNIAPNASIEQILSLSLEYHLVPINNFYIGTWIGYEEWEIPLLITTTKVTNWALTPQVGYRWMPLNNLFINVGYRTKLVFAASSEDSILNDNFRFKSIIAEPTLGLGLKF